MTETTTQTTVRTSDGDSASMLAGLTSPTTKGAAGKPAPKPAPAKRTSKTTKPAGKTAPKPAQKVTSTKTRTPATDRPANQLPALLGDDYAGTLTDAKREVARWMVDVFNALIAGKNAPRWVPNRHGGIPLAFAAAIAASTLNYAPVPPDYWGDSLPPRSGAGGRGAKGRIAAAAPVKSTARKSSATKPAPKPAQSSTRKPAQTKPASRAA